MEPARREHAKRRPSGFRNAGSRRGRLDGIAGRPPPHHRPGDDHRPAAVSPAARHLGRHHLLGNSGLPGLPGRPVRGHRAARYLGRAAVVAGRGRRHEPACPVRGRIRRRDARPQPVHRTAGRGRRLLHARAQHPADPRQPVVLADLAAGHRSLGHRARRGCRDLLPLPPGPAHRPGDVPRRAHRGGAGRPGPARRPRRTMAAPARRGRHRGRAAGGRDRRRAGRHRTDGPARNDRHPGPARRGQRPAGPLHPGLQPHRDPGLPEPRLRELPAGRHLRPRTGAQPASRPTRCAGPDQPGRRDLSPGRRQLRQCRPGWPAHQRQAAGIPPAPSRPGARTHPDHQRLGRRGAVKRRARHRGQRHRRRPQRIPGAAGSHGGAEDSSRPAAARLAARDPAGRQPGAQAVAARRCEAPAASCPASPPARAAGASSQPPEAAPGSPAYAAARRFAALPAPARHAWLVQHLAALRAGRITLEQLP